MSDPIRYSIVADYQAPWAKMHEFRAGGWVKWEDYASLHSQFANSEQENARLKAEVEMLRNLATKIDAYVDVLVLENGRLRKAGDAMADALSPFRNRPFDTPYLCDLQMAWQQAKEGKPSV